MVTPRVSVFLPCRNAAATLPAAITSILAQTFRDFELIIVDHLSEDETPELLRRYAIRDPRIQVLSSHATFVEASNLAWQTGKGEFLARMDADDEALPDRLHLQVSFLDENPDLAACATQVRIRKRLENGRVVAPDGGYARYEDWINSVISPEHISRERFVDSPFPNPTAMIRRSVMEQVGGYADPSWAEDYDLWLRVLEKGHRLGKVERPLLDWIDAPMRSTRTVERYQLSRFQEAKAHYLSHFESVKEKGVVIAGAGPIGKEMNRLLEAEEITRHAFLEVNARQVGNKAGGIPILGSEEIAGFQSEAILIGALGQPGARARLQKLACETGFTEGVDFFCVA